MKTFIISDTHFGHANIIKYCNRPFKDVNHMDHELIRRWNERVSENDIVYFLGDFMFSNSYNGDNGLKIKPSYYLDQLNGYIQFVQGNHDKQNKLRIKTLGCVVEHAKQKYYMVHKPDHFNSNYEINFCGHVHDEWLIQRRENSWLINCSVEKWDYRPRTFEEILKKAKYEIDKRKL